MHLENDGLAETMKQANLHVPGLSNGNHFNFMGNRNMCKFIANIISWPWELKHED